MKMISARLMCVLVTMCTVTAYAQKGLPEKTPTNASVNTNYPQHEDFKETMLSRLKVPAGFKISVAATGLGKPRMMAQREDGSIYITRRDVGDVLLISDKDGDGRYEDLKTVFTNFKGVHGITIHEGKLYLCADETLKRFSMNADGTLTDSVTLINDMPDGGQHPNRTIAFGPDGMLYITVGSDCNDCSETNPEYATILQANPDGSNRKIYARGLRNTIGFDWHPQTKELWGADQGTDWRGDTIPGEEINKIIKDGDYGWPLVFEKQKVDVTREDPLGTTKEAYAKTTQPAVMLLPAHSAAINFLFLNHPAMPKTYANDALVTLHGSWNAKKPVGYMIKRIHYENGKPVSADDFLTGMLSKDGKTRFGRPAGLLLSAKGILYLSDDENGVIYSIVPNAVNTGQSASINK
jgi:glucose/arabinose dehydrogenase